MTPETAEQAKTELLPIQKHSAREIATWLINETRMRCYTGTRERYNAAMTLAIKLGAYSGHMPGYNVCSVFIGFYVGKNVYFRLEQNRKGPFTHFSQTKDTIFRVTFWERDGRGHGIPSSRKTFCWSPGEPEYRTLPSYGGPEAYNYEPGSWRHS